MCENGLVSDHVLMSASNHHHTHQINIPAQITLHILFLAGPLAANSKLSRLRKFPRQNLTLHTAVSSVPAGTGAVSCPHHNCRAGPHHFSSPMSHGLSF